MQHRKNKRSLSDTGDTYSRQGLTPSEDPEPWFKLQASRPAAMWISSSRPNMSYTFTVNDVMETGGRHSSRQGSTRTRESNRFEMEAALRIFLSAALHKWVTGSTSDHCYFGSIVAGKFRLLPSPAGVRSVLNSKR